MTQGPLDRVLDEIVRIGAISRHRQREAPQPRHECRDLASDRVIRRVHLYVHNGGGYYFIHGRYEIVERTCTELNDKEKLDRHGDRSELAMRRTLLRMACLATLSLAFAGPAAAGALGGIGVGGVTNLPGQVLGGVNRTTGGLRNELGNTVQSVARDTVGRPADARLFERDSNGARVLRHTVLLLAPSPQDLAIAKQLNFEISRSDNLPSLGLDVVQLRAPSDMDSTTALATLRKADPSATFDYDHIYDPSGGASVSTNSAAGPSIAEHGAVLPREARVGMIDGGIARQHGAFAAAALTTKNVAADGNSPPTAHGTAIASLLVGQEGDFQGYLMGARLFAADVYGGQSSGGGALEIARALDWLAANNVAVVNVSLAGPANAILERAVALFHARGGIIVAAAGNSGAAGAPSYPASYPGVVGVTSVDAQYHLEVDASRDAQFAALGVDVRAAKLDRGFARFTGTSFATPVVSARLALLFSRSDPTAAAAALNQLQRDAKPLERSAARFGYLEPPHVSKISAQQ